jgi:hypothetical protein
MDDLGPHHCLNVFPWPTMAQRLNHVQHKEVYSCFRLDNDGNTNKVAGGTTEKMK